MPGLPLYALWVAALAVLASPLYIQEFSLPGCTGAVLQSVDVSSSGYCFTLGGEARADVQSFFGLSFGFYSYLATYAYTSCATNDASSSWTATVYGKLGGTGCSSSDVSISGQSFSASQTCWNVGADGYGRSVDTSLLITCGSPSPTSSPSFSPTPSVSASATPSPSVALRYYFQSPDCLGARNDTYFAVGDLTGCNKNDGLGQYVTLSCNRKSQPGSWSFQSHGSSSCSSVLASHAGTSQSCYRLTNETSLLVFCAGSAPALSTAVLAFVALIIVILSA